jgi:hypothetical protein
MKRGPSLATWTAAEPLVNPIHVNRVLLRAERRTALLTMTLPFFV